MPSIVYTFTATGHPGVMSAFRSIGDAADMSAKRVTNAVARMGRSAARAGKQIADSNAMSWSRVNSVSASGNAERIAMLERALVKEKAMLARSVRAFEDAERRKSAATEREGQKRVNQSQRNQKKASKGGVMGRIGRGVASFATISAGMALTAGVGTSLRQQVRLEDEAKMLAIRGTAAGGPALSGAALANQARQTAMEVPGVSAEQALSGTSKFQELTGDIRLATEAQKTFARVSLATGARIEDIAEAAGAMYNQFDIGTSKELGDMLAVFTMQGKKGSFEIKDLAKNLQKLAASARTLGVSKSKENLATIGGLAQLSRQSAGSAPQAATALEASFRMMMSKAGKIKDKYGVDVRELAKGDLAEFFPTLLKSVNVKDLEKELGGRASKEEILAAKGDPIKMSNLFAKRAFTGVATLVNKFNEFKETTGDADKAAEMLVNVIRETTSAEGAAAAMARDIAAAQETTGAKMTHAWEQISNIIFANAKPALDEFVKQLPSLINALPPLIKMLGMFASSLMMVVQGLQEVPILKELFKESPETRIQNLQMQKGALEVQSQLYDPSQIKDPKARAAAVEQQERAKQQIAQIDAQIAAARNEMASGWRPSDETRRMQFETPEELEKYRKRVRQTTGMGTVLGASGMGLAGLAYLANDFDPSKLQGMLGEGLGTFAAGAKEKVDMVKDLLPEIDTSGVADKISEYIAPLSDLQDAASKATDALNKIGTSVSVNPLEP